MPGFKKRNSSQSQAIVSDIGLEYPLQEEGSIEEMPRQSVKSYYKNRRVVMGVCIIIGSVIGLLLTVASVFAFKEVRQSLYSDSLVLRSTGQQEGLICTNSVCYKAANFMRNYLNETVDPCNDFYQFACGFSFEERADDVDHFSMAHDQLIKDLSDLLQRPLDETAPDSVNKFKTLYRSCLAEDRIERNSDKEFVKYLSTELGAWPMMNEKNVGDTQYSFEKYIAKVAVVKSPLLFRFQSDILNFTKIIMRILTPADYCKLQNFIPDGSDKMLVKRFKNLFQQIKEFLQEDHIDKTDASFNEQFDDMLNFAQKIYFINSTKYKCGIRKTDIEIKQLILSPEQFNQEINKKVRAEGLSEFNFMEFLNHTDVDTSVTLNMQIWITSFALEYVKDLFYNLAKSYNYNTENAKNALRNFVYFHTILDFLNLKNTLSAPLFPLRYYQALYEYAKYIYPNVNPRKFYLDSYSKERTETCMYLFIGGFESEGMGEDREFQKFYLNEKFDQMSKNQTSAMIEEMLKTSHEYIQSIEWIDDQTKRSIAESLYDLKFQIAFSDTIFLNVGNSKETGNTFDYVSDYAVNLLMLRKNNFKRQFRYLNQDQYQYYRSKSFVFNIFLANLMYSKEYNTILVPAGVLMQPIFNTELPNYLNYATVGVYISHEIWHMIHELLLLSSSRGAYLTRINRLTESYSGYAKEKYNFEIEAEHAIEEQIADYFGVKIAFKTYQRLTQSWNKTDSLLPGLNYSQEELFFIRYSQGYCRKRSYLSESIFHLEHGVEEFRVFETVLLGEFSKVFKCQQKKQKYQIEDAIYDIFDGS